MYVYMHTHIHTLTHNCTSAKHRKAYTWHRSPCQPDIDSAGLIRAYFLRNRGIEKTGQLGPTAIQVVISRDLGENIIRATTSRLNPYFIALFYLMWNVSKIWQVSSSNVNEQWLPVPGRWEPLV